MYIWGRGAAVHQLHHDVQLASFVRFERGEVPYDVWVAQDLPEPRLVVCGRVDASQHLDGVQLHIYDLLLAVGHSEGAVAQLGALVVDEGSRRLVCV